MRIITGVETFILHVPVTRGGIADSTHHLTHWGAPGVVLHTDDGLRGYGYTGTHAHLATDRLITSCIADTYGPLLLGQHAADVGADLWDRLLRFPPAMWVGRCGITHLALAAVDVALWDLRAKAAAQPLWRLLGGRPKAVEAYDTNGGWLNWSAEELVADARRLVEEGCRGVKIKVGGPDLEHDIERVTAVRRAVGANVKVMVDANGRWDVPTALRACRRLDSMEVYWIEEPIWYDDVEGHATLAREVRTPIALGEQLYRLDDFRAFIGAGAVHFVQADAVRLAGITEWWRVADLAHQHGLPVVAHIGDMAQVHLHLSIAHPACRMLEYIPWMRECFEEPVALQHGYFDLPHQPGAGTTLRPDAIDRWGVR